MNRRSLLKALATLPFWGLAAREIVAEPFRELWSMSVCLDQTEGGKILEYLEIRATDDEAKRVRAALYNKWRGSGVEIQASVWPPAATGVLDA